MGKASRSKRERVEAPSSTAISVEPRRPLIVRPIPILLLLAFLAALIYFNTFSSSFHFDDRSNIVNNPRIRDLANFSDISGARYVGFLTFALNYHFGGTAVFGYHLVNLLIHVLNGFLVYCLVLLLFKANDIGDPSHSENVHGIGRASDCALWVALATAVLFVVHPVQTQAVTYVVQRFASLAALFYLLAVICYLKWRLSHCVANSQRLFWYIGALLSTVLAMKTKETTFTLPFMFLLVERTFFRPFKAKQWATLIPLLLTLPIIPLSHLDALGEAEGFARETTEISRASYLFTQFRVIVTYLRLMILPIGQNLDYDYPIYHSFLAPPVFLSFLLLAIFFFLALYLLLRTQFKLVAFGILWFFLVLSAESSIFPIRDVIFEHRLYLPAVGIFMAVAIGLVFVYTRARSEGRRRGLVGVFLVIVLALGSATYRRNLVWQDELSLWRDVVAKAPKKARGHINLGGSYELQKNWKRALQEYQTAIILKPDYPEVYNNLGNVYAAFGAREEAIETYKIALKLHPAYAEAHNNLGTVYAEQGRLSEAIPEFQAAVKANPTNAAVRTNLGNALRQIGMFDEAAKEFQQALQIDPGYLPARQALQSLPR